MEAPMKRSLTTPLVALLMVAALSAPTLAEARPPKDAIPLSTIVLSLEKMGFGPIVEVKFDDGVWEVEAWRDGQKRELKIDPRSGRILSDRLDD
jgi:hypothetical protein